MSLVHFVSSVTTCGSVMSVYLVFCLWEGKEELGGRGAPGGDNLRNHFLIVVSIGEFERDILDRGGFTGGGASVLQDTYHSRERERLPLPILNRV